MIIIFILILSCLLVLCFFVFLLICPVEIGQCLIHLSILYAIKYGNFFGWIILIYMIKVTFFICNYLCICHTVFSDISAQKLGMYIIHKNYRIIFFSLHITQHIQDQQKLSYIYSPNWYVLHCYKKLTTGVCVCVCVCVCVLIILFLLMWAACILQFCINMAYICSKYDVDFVSKQCSLYKFLFFINTNQ